MAQDIVEQKLDPILKPIEKLFRVKNAEELVKRLIVIACIVVLLIPIVLLPLFFFFYSELHLGFLG